MRNWRRDRPLLRKAHNKVWTEIRAGRMPHPNTLQWIARSRRPLMTTATTANRLRFSLFVTAATRGAAQARHTTDRNSGAGGRRAMMNARAIDLWRRYLAETDPLAADLLYRQYLEALEEPAALEQARKPPKMPPPSAPRAA
jgi:hypothetical protein